MPAGRSSDLLRIRDGADTVFTVSEEEAVFELATRLCGYRVRLIATAMWVDNRISPRQRTGRLGDRRGTMGARGLADVNTGVESALASVYHGDVGCLCLT